jgi:hypothetical protein
MMRWAGNIACIRVITNSYNILVGTPEGKRPLGRPRRKWEDIIRMAIRKIEWIGWTGCIRLRIRFCGGLL